jgi:hypothetical protein
MEAHQHSDANFPHDDLGEIDEVVAPAPQPSDVDLTHDGNSEPC